MQFQYVKIYSAFYTGCSHTGLHLLLGAGIEDNARKNHHGQGRKKLCVVVGKCLIEELQGNGQRSVLIAGRQQGRIEIFVPVPQEG